MATLGASPDRVERSGLTYAAVRPRRRAPTSRTWFVLIPNQAGCRLPRTRLPAGADARTRRPAVHAIHCGVLKTHARRQLVGGIARAPGFEPGRAVLETAMLAVTSRPYGVVAVQQNRPFPRGTGGGLPVSSRYLFHPSEVFPSCLTWRSQDSQSTPNSDGRMLGVA